MEAAEVLTQTNFARSRSASLMDPMSYRATRFFRFGLSEFHGAVAGLDQLVLYMAVVDHLRLLGEQRAMLRRHLDPLVQTFNPVRHRAVCCPHDLLDDLDLLWRECVERLEPARPPAQTGRDPA